MVYDCDDGHEMQEDFESVAHVVSTKTVELRFSFMTLIGIFPAWMKGCDQPRQSNSSILLYDPK